jgi:hypothetical protein
MPNPDVLFEAAVHAFRAELSAGVQAVSDARTPREFTDAEREIGRLSRQFADDLVRRALQSASTDPERVREAMSGVNKKAARRGITVRSVGRRPTKMRLLGRNLVDLTTPYASAKPRGGKSCKQRGAQGTGVYPVLDQLGILGRSTPALRLLVSRAMCEANSISAGRELLAAGGVTLDHKAALRLTYEVCDDGLRARKEAVRSTQQGQSGVLSGRRVVAAVDGGRLQVRVPMPGRPRRGGRRHFLTELAIGSGAVESAVRRVIYLRLKGASVAWLVEHAEGMLHLRAHAKSGRWTDLEDAVLENTGWRPTARQPRHAA